MNNKTLKDIPIYKENWIYSLIEQLQEKLNEALDKLYEFSDELYRVKKENETLKARLADIEKAVCKDD